MEIEQRKWTKKDGWQPASSALGNTAHLVLVFGDTPYLRKREHFYGIKDTYPQAHIVGCSSAGEICGVQVFDNSLVSTAIKFTHSSVKVACLQIKNRAESLAIGKALAKSFDYNGLVHVFVLSDGLNVNGSALVKGLINELPRDVMITGGLSGDGGRFVETLVMCDKPAKKNLVSAVGLYGDRLQVGYGSMGGWDPFGPERLITHSAENVLYELDGKSALTLYKKYLGEHANALPASGLLFPLSIRFRNSETRLVRTILSIEEMDQGMVFAGDMPEGAYAQFMKANFNRLIDGAVGAAKASIVNFGGLPTSLSLLVSCIGRKMVLKQRVEEELEGVQDVLGSQAVLAGFYSYGEIAPATNDTACELHNQTMTITNLSERMT